MLVNFKSLFIWRFRKNHTSFETYTECVYCGSFNIFKKILVDIMHVFSFCWGKKNHFCCCMTDGNHKRHHIRYVWNRSYEFQFYTQMFHNKRSFSQKCGEQREQSVWVCACTHIHTYLYIYRYVCYDALDFPQE